LTSVVLPETARVSEGRRPSSRELAKVGDEVPPVHLRLERLHVLQQGLKAHSLQVRSRILARRSKLLDAWRARKR